MQKFEKVKGFAFLKCLDCNLISFETVGVFIPFSRFLTSRTLKKIIIKNHSISIE